MTPEERRAAIQRFGYREPVRFADGNMLGLMLTFPVALLAGAVAAMSSGGVGGWLAGSGFLVAAVAVASWAWTYFKKPSAPDDDADFEREIRYRIEDDQRSA